MASKHKRGNAWYLHWREEGKTKKKSLGPVSVEEADAQLAALEKQIQAIPHAAGPMFADWCVEYSYWHKAEYPSSYPRVRQIMESHLIPHFQGLPVGVISRREVEAFKHARLAAGVTAGTVTKELRTLQAIINKAVEWEIIPRNRAKGVKPPKDLNSAPPHWYTVEDLQAIYQIESTPRVSTSKANIALHQKYRWTWQLLANTGMRRGEAISLEWRNVGKTEIKVISADFARTKSAKWRLIPVSDGAMEALQELKDDRRRVLPEVTKPSLSRAFSRTLERAKLEGSIHCLRHTYCSQLVMSGIPLRTVQVLAGHSSIKTTENYAHLAPGYLQESIRELRL